MKLVLVALSWSLSLGSLGFAQEDSTPDKPSTPPAATPPVATPPVATPPADDTAPKPAPDPEAVKKAEALLDEVAKAYRDLKTLTDTIKLEMKPAMGPAMEMQVALGKGRDASMQFPGVKVTSLDGKLYVERDDVAKKYAAIEFTGTLASAIQEAFEGQVPVPPQIVFRSESDRKQQVASLGMAMLGESELAITGYKPPDATDDQENPAHQVNLANEAGEAVVHVDPKTKLIRNIVVDIKPATEDSPMGPPMQITVDLSMSPQVHDELPTAIAFDPGDRKAVKNIEGLEPGLAEGDVAPDFTLDTLAGEPVTLSKLQGSVVVLDFWATWCGPCRRGLPKVQEFATWAQSSGHPIKVYAVNVWEKEPDAASKKTTVETFWTTAKYEMPTLMDKEDGSTAKAYQLTSIPLTLIIGPDGKVAAIHRGFDPTSDIVADLKKEALAALKTEE